MAVGVTGVASIALSLPHGTGVKGRVRVGPETPTNKTHTQIGQSPCEH